MEVFSTQQSTKRTVSPPSPHPIGPQSCCSAPPGSRPLGPHQAPGLHGTAGSILCWDPCPSGRCVPAHWGTTGSPPYRAPHPLGPLGPRSTWDCQIPALLYTCPTGPSSVGDHWIMALPSHPPLVLSRPRTAGLPDSHSTRPLHGRPPQEGSKPA
jgi:hypothetical protein